MSDPLVNDSFDRVYRRGQAEVKSRISAVQGRLKTAHSVSLGFIMLLVKTSPQVLYFFLVHTLRFSFVYCAVWRCTALYGVVLYIIVLY